MEGAIGDGALFVCVVNIVKKRVVVAMSGGVDSSVTAALLLEQGYEVIGMTMQLKSSGTLGSPDSRSEGDPVRGAGRIAELLGIPLHVVDFSADFQDQIIAPFCREYYSGRTPNPCVICNKRLKFGSLLDRALALEADYLATGHYVKLFEEDGRYLVAKGADPLKDQSYFLFALSQRQLQHSLFPLGTMTKDRVRELALSFNLPVAEKPESQDICFIPDGEYIRFLEQHFENGRCGGEIVHVSGKVIGAHKGVHRYTIGQRKGLGIGWTEPLYVVGIDAQAKKVIVGEKQHLSRRELVAAGCNWNIPEPQGEIQASCRIRYRHRETPALIVPLEDSRVQVVFDDPQDGITPGQAAVFYRGDRVIGGGWIQ